jgi:hypothetical protein
VARQGPGRPQRWMAALDRIRLTGLLRKAPAARGLSISRIERPRLVRLQVGRCPETLRCCSGEAGYRPQNARAPADLVRHPAEGLSDFLAGHVSGGEFSHRLQGGAQAESPAASGERRAPRGWGSRLRPKPGAGSKLLWLIALVLMSGAVR